VYIQLYESTLYSTLKVRKYESTSVRLLKVLPYVYCTCTSVCCRLYRCTQLHSVSHSRVQRVQLYTS